MAGGVLVTLGLVGMAFAPSLPWVYVFYGAIAGLGNGLIGTPKLVVLSLWFERLRGRATSLSLMSAGLGSLAMAPFFLVCFNYYGYSGTLLLLAGCTAHFVVTGVLAREPWPAELEAASRRRAPAIAEKTAHQDSIAATKLRDGAVYQEHIICGSLDDFTIIATDVRRKSVSLTALNKQEKRILTVSPAWFSHGNLITMDDATVGKGNVPNYTLWISSDGSKNRDTLISHASSDELASPAVMDAQCATGQVQPESQPSCGDKLARYLNYRLLRDPKLVAFSLMMASGSMCFSTVNTHLAGLGRERDIGIVNLGGVLVAMGLINTAGKLSSGFLFDWRPVRSRRHHLFSMVGATVGITLLLAPLTDTVNAFYAVWLVYMLLASIVTSQESLILADIVPRQSYPSAVGLSRFFRAFGVLVGPTFGGHLKDVTGIYAYTFVSCGCAFLLASCIFEVVVSWSSLRHLRQTLSNQKRTGITEMPETVSHPDDKTYAA